MDTDSLTLNYPKGVPMDEARNDSFRQAALDYHEFPKPGKLEIRATKPLANGRDLIEQSALRLGYLLQI